MAANLVKKTFTSDSTWVCPSNVKAVRVVGRPLAAFAQVTSGSASGGYGISAAGPTYSWGSNSTSALGDGTSSNKSSPVQVVGGISFVKIAGGDSSNQYAVGIDVGGAAWTWGANGQGQLGQGSTSDQNSPSQVVGGLKFSQIACAIGAVGGGNMIGVSTSGSMWAWGYNANGQLGNGVNPSSLPSASSPVPVAGGLKFIQSAMGGQTAYGLTASGDAWAWGDNSSGGQLGTGSSSPNSVSSPVQVTGGLKFVQLVASSFAAAGLTSAGDIWAWGFNPAGQLGDGTTTSRSSPVKVVGGLKFVSICGGGSTFSGITIAGDTYSWGANSSGQLGDGTILAKSSPVLVVGGLKFVEVSSNGTTVNGVSQGVTAAGVMYSWGSGNSGALGDGTIVSKSSPVKVVGGIVFSTAAFSFASQQEQIVSVTPGTVYQIKMTTPIKFFGTATTFPSTTASLVLEYFS